MNSGGILAIRSFLRFIYISLLSYVRLYPISGDLGEIRTRTIHLIIYFTDKSTFLTLETYKFFVRDPNGSPFALLEM